LFKEVSSFHDAWLSPLEILARELVACIMRHSPSEVENINRFIIITRLQIKFLSQLSKSMGPQLTGRERKVQQPLNFRVYGSTLSLKNS